MKAKGNKAIIVIGRQVGRQVCRKIDMQFGRLMSNMAPS